jgi:muconolactone delta-isomerase
MPMKYMISWFERPQGSPMEYENAQKRILEVFTQWKAPDNFKIELFVIRVGDWGGYMLLDCDDPLAVHKFCSMLPAFEFQARPVVPVMDAVRVELEAIAFRDGLQRKWYSRVSRHIHLVRTGDTSVALCGIEKAALNLSAVFFIFFRPSSSGSWRGQDESTGLRGGLYEQPANVACGSKCENLAVSKCFPVFPR